MGFKGGDLPLNGHSIYSIPEIFIGFEGGNLLLDQFCSLREFSIHFEGCDLPPNGICSCRWVSRVNIPEIFIGFEGGNLLLDQFR